MNNPKKKVSDKILSDLGEMDLLKKIIFPHHKRPKQLPNALGDDCLEFPIKLLRNTAVWTMDPTPLPVSWLIDQKDFYVFGWYSVLINLSDIASMGAIPFGLLLSVVAPSDMKVDDYIKFLDGVEDCCRRYNTYILGGNMKDGKEFTCTGTALGSVDKKNILNRVGSKPGDLIVSIGEMGAFWASILSKINKFALPKKLSERLNKALYTPVPRLKEGGIVAEHNLATACMDNSDSVVSCCYEMAKQNNLDFVITLTEKQIDPKYSGIFNKLCASTLTPALSWGDWNLIMTVRPNKFGELQKRLKELCTVTKIGEVRPPRSNTGGAYYLSNEHLKPLNKNICSERFKNKSYFTHGIEQYIEMLEKEMIWE